MDPTIAMVVMVVTKGTGRWWEVLGGCGTEDWRSECPRKT
jgi:hypothetical protein